MNITLSKLAKLANVSVSTASKAFSMSNEVNEQTREHIFKIAKEQSCFKKFFKAKYPKLVIAVITPEMNGEYYPEIFKELQTVLPEINCEIVASVSNFSSDELLNLINYYEKYTMIDAIVILDDISDLNLNCEIPIISFSDAIGNGKHIRIDFDQESAISEVIRMFKENGFEQICFLGESHTQTKLRLFKKIVLQEYGNIDEDCIVITEERFEAGGYNGMKKLLKKSSSPKAILCAYDRMAYGALKCIRDNNLSVPQDVMIVGINNSTLSKYCIPSLSTIDMAITKRAELIASLLQALILGKETEKSITIRADFIERESAYKIK